MAQQRDAGRRRSQQHPLLLVADHVNSLALPEGFDFKNVELGDDPASLDRELLPIAE